MTTALKPNKIEIALATGVIALVLSTKPVNAQSQCSSVPLSGDYTCTATGEGCYITIADTVDGVDNAGGQETSTTNNAVLTIADGAVLTVPSGVSGSTKLVVGSITIADGGSITIGSNASIEIGKPLYMTDADADGFPDSTTYYDATSSGRRRKSLAKSISAVDCAPADGTKWQLLNAYGDADGDGQTGSTATEGCYGESAPGGGTPGTDCDDNNAYAYLNSTYCMTTARSGGSFDYNCSSTQTLCGTTYNRSCTGGTGSTRICIGAGSTNCGSSDYTYYAAATFTCGQTGCYGTGTGTDYNSCTTGSTRCSRGSTASYTSSVSSGVQACQ